MVWLKIDKPTKKCTIHLDPNCTYNKDKQETQYMGIDELKRDGGWLRFPNVREAKEYYLSKYDTYMLIEHCFSNQKDEMNLANNKSNKSRNDYIQPMGSFNSATDHYNRIVGLSTKRVNPNTLPKPIRIFYYSIISIMAIGSVIALLTILFKG